MTRESEKALDVYRDGIVTRVDESADHYSVTYREAASPSTATEPPSSTAHWSLGWAKTRGGLVPKPGDHIRAYGPFGHRIHGVDINSQQVYYLTHSEREAKHEALLANSQADRRQRFEQDRDKLDAAYHSLPAIFQRRIDKFRRTNPDFRWEFESYEMMCCEDAVRIARYLMTTDDPEAPPVPLAPAADRWQVRFEWFKALSFDEQVWNAGISDSHSGNSFGTALRLAWWYAVQPSMVELEHGALVPLVGCSRYGCPHD